MIGVAVGAERWAAIRALREGEPQTFPLIAAACGLHPVTLRRRASQERWAPRPDIAAEAGVDDGTAGAEEAGADDAPAEGAADSNAPAGNLEERLARVMELLLGEVEAVGAAAKRRGGVLDKKRIDGLWSMIRTLEKFEGFARERSRDSQTRRDGEMADVLRRIDARIVELARAYAEELGDGQRVGGGSGADPR